MMILGIVTLCRSCCVSYSSLSGLINVQFIICSICRIHYYNLSRIFIAHSQAKCIIGISIAVSSIKLARSSVVSKRLNVLSKFFRHPVAPLT